MEPAGVEPGDGYTDVPWSWSDQYTWTLQCAGIEPGGADQLVTAEADAILVLTHSEGRLHAATGFAPGTTLARAVGSARAVIAAGAPVDIEALKATSSLAETTKILRAAGRRAVGQ